MALSSTQFPLLETTTRQVHADILREMNVPSFRDLKRFGKRYCRRRSNQPSHLGSTSIPPHIDLNALAEDYLSGQFNDMEKDMTLLILFDCGRMTKPTILRPERVDGDLREGTAISELSLHDLHDLQAIYDIACVFPLGHLKVNETRPTLLIRFSRKALTEAVILLGVTAELHGGNSKDLEIPVRKRLEEGCRTLRERLGTHSPPLEKLLEGVLPTDREMTTREFFEEKMRRMMACVRVNLKEAGANAVEYRNNTGV